MIKNIVFDIGNVILNFDIKRVLKEYTSDSNTRKFILDNIINSPEWLGNALIDTGYLKVEDAIKIVCDRTNHINDKVIIDFWTTYLNYAYIDKKMLELIIRLKENGYHIYLLSNINPYTYNYILEKSNLFDIVDGYVLSYQVHMIKPYQGIYKELLQKFALEATETLFIDDNLNNIKTAILLDIKGIKVKPDNYQDVEDKLKKNNIKF